METVSDEILQKAINLLGNPDLSQEQIEASLCSVGVEPQVALRLALFLPEAFGFILAGHMKEKIAPISTFSAQDQNGKWESIPYSSEPIFVLAINAAQALFHSGPRSLFQTVATRSSVISVINDALNKGVSIEGASMAIAVNGVPAEIYPKVKRTLFEKFLDWRLRKLKKAATQNSSSR